MKLSPGYPSYDATFEIRVVTKKRLSEKMKSINNKKEEEKWRKSTHSKLFHLVLKDVLVVTEGALEEVASHFGRSLCTTLVKPEMWDIK